ncbi:MAG: sodium:proton antiporter [Acidobacteria bacterium]|nr:sodium:proton antiporter [Acidobacteriota bacterium]
MDRVQIVGILLTLTAVYCYINHRWLRLPVTIGVMVVALGISLLMNLLAWVGFGPEEQPLLRWLRHIDFNKAVLHGMLSYLLFAGALQLNLRDLIERKWAVGFLASAGVLLSTFFVGTLTWWGLRGIGIELSYAYCLLFGALISPTDAVAVLGALKTARVPKRLEMTITGEALFNDGVAIVAFVVLLGLATGTHTLSPESIGVLFLQEAVGGALFGLGVGSLAHHMLKSSDHPQVAVLVTLAVVTGGYALADFWGLSGPIAVVVAGLWIGNWGRRAEVSKETRSSLEIFWELIEQVYNAVLFALLGLESLLLEFTPTFLLAGLLAFVVVLVSRFLSVGLPVVLLHRWQHFRPGAIHIMTWGGLRGGVSVALALSIPLSGARSVILAMTYVVVVLSIVLQGLTMERLIKRTLREELDART